METTAISKNNVESNKKCWIKEQKSVSLSKWPYFNMIVFIYFTIIKFQLNYLQLFTILKCTDAIRSIIKILIS